MAKVPVDGPEGVWMLIAAAGLLARLHPPSNAPRRQAAAGHARIEGTSGEGSARKLSP
jgi:hypothetical protein